MSVLTVHASSYLTSKRGKDSSVNGTSTSVEPASIVTQATASHAQAADVASEGRAEAVAEGDNAQLQAQLLVCRRHMSRPPSPWVLLHHRLSAGYAEIQRREKNETLQCYG